MKPILFNSEMVKAILEGKKTQTRRVIKPQPEIRYVAGWGIAGYKIWMGLWQKEPTREEWQRFAERQAKTCPYGHAGDKLWVRETWATETYDDDKKPSDLNSNSQLWYKATKETWNPKYCLVSELYSRGKTRPSIYMPHWASRIMLEIKDVCVEKICDISYSDAIAEGLPAKKNPNHPRLKFKELWDSINAKSGYSWESNPWVWVIEF